MADSLVAALKAAGFKGKALPVAYAIVKRESGGNPRAYNPNRATGDLSYGLSQVNMLGRMGADRRRAYGLKSNEDLFDPATNLRVMYAMSKGGRDFGPWGVGPRAYRQTAPLNLAQFPGDTSPSSAPPAAAQPSAEPVSEGGSDRRALALALLSRSRARRGADPISPVLQALLTRPQQEQPASVAPAVPSPPAGATTPLPPPATTASPTSDAGGFTDDFNQRLEALIAASGGKLTVTSGYRSPERQAELFAAAVKKYGSVQAARKWVAPPGRSNHGRGIAADLGGDLDWAHENAARFGLYFPMSWEAWHVEPVGSRGR